MKNVSVLSLSLSLLLPILAHAAGAIAVDDEQGETEPGYGLATGADTRADAARDAMKFCREEGNKGCKWLSGLTNVAPTLLPKSITALAMANLLPKPNQWPWKHAATQNAKFWCLTANKT